MLREYKRDSSQPGSGKTQRPWLLARQIRVRTERQEHDCVQGTTAQVLNGWQIVRLVDKHKFMEDTQAEKLT